MKRNMDLIRMILIEVEGEEAVDLAEYSTEELVYHRSLVIEAGLCEGAVHIGSGYLPEGVVVHRLTWAGHEYLDSIRSESVWQKTKETFKNQGLSMTIDLAKTVAIKVATDLLFR